MNRVNLTPREGVCEEKLNFCPMAATLKDRSTASSCRELPVRNPPKAFRSAALRPDLKGVIKHEASSWTAGTGRAPLSFFNNGELMLIRLSNWSVSDGASGD